MQRVKEKLLEIRHLSIEVTATQKHLVDDVNLVIEAGEIMGLVGESGSGKSMTALAIMGLLPEGIEVTSGEAFLQGINLFSMSNEERRDWMGRKMAMVFQEPMTSLNPVQTIGKQIEEMLCIHTSYNKEQRMQEVVQILREVGLDSYDPILSMYPHQLSGGMRQRVMIAIAMILCPSLLICDEPTTALDVKVQEQILSLVQALNRGKQTAVLFISHDIGVIQSICRQAAVMYHGQIVEQNEIQNLVQNPQNAYTKELMAALPSASKRLCNPNQETEKKEIMSLHKVNLGYNKKILIRDLSFTLYEGEILGMVGPSGCGKSTVARAITGLLPIRGGELCLHQERPQMVFQDPYSSLNPAYCIRWILEEPMKIHGGYSKEERSLRVNEVIQDVGMDVSYLNRKITELSGGQRQRISLAAALTCHPKILVLDEPVSALDVTVQDKVLKLLAELRAKYQMAYLLISHDSAVLEQMCDRMIHLEEWVV